VFYHDKLHLTEKIFKPIVAQRPFMLAAAPGNLAYLKSYGFQTFDRWIDESYDNIQDPVARLEAVVKLMQSLASLSPEEKQQLYANLDYISRYNKQRFFSEEFTQQVVNEFKTNFNHGVSFIQQADSHEYYNRDFKRLSKLAAITPKLLL
jgi:hypothetical protein